MSKYKEKICVLGLGYIGLPTAAILSNRGFTVHGVDVNQEIVETINKGDIHIIEPGLNKLVKSSIEKGKLIAYFEWLRSCNPKANGSLIRNVSE